METKISFNYRKSILEKERRYELTENGINIYEEDNCINTILYKDIQSIRILYKPQRYRTTNYACIIKTNQSKILLQSTSYKSLANFIDLNEQYALFVRALVKIVDAKNPSAKIASGHTTFQYIAYTIFLILVGIIVFFALNLPVAIGFTIVLRLILIAYLVYYSIKMLGKNVPKEIKNGEIPKSVLP